ncbi:smoothelin isoform X2 [Talpa occidentalis]|uniref:smoothelin isoform X2 n=1 Tax=Talpa occidentalis TaxID=50954 RepID=UPI00189009F0|nr:smoothelin isoform X2 [Talpa occidentalis]
MELGAGKMVDEALAGLDEGALRKLLEVTADLAERRRIRSAIRELQRQELEREEEALASKRFRAERQDNKENWLHSQKREAEQRAALARLAGRLESMSDVEELTVLLRSAGEYEERKLIRAAIRRVRAQEIEAATLAGRLCSGRPNSDSSENSKGLAAHRLEQCEVPEREQKQQVEVPEPTPSPEGTNQDVTTVTLLLRAAPGGTPRSPTSPNSSPTTASPEPPLEPTEAQCPADKAVGTSEPPPTLSRATSPETQELPAPPCTEGQVVNKLQPGPTEPAAAEDSTRSASNTKRTDMAGPRPCQRSLSVLRSRQPVQNQEPTPLAGGLSPFQRAGSVRDRVRKFTSDSPVAVARQDGSSRAELGPSTPARLPGPSLISTTPASSSNNSSQDPGATSSQFKLTLRAPPTLLSTSSGGKSTITHISSPGTLSRVGNVTQVTSFSHASPGNRRGYSIKMEPEPAEPSAAVEVAHDAKQTQVNKAPERRSPLSTEELMAIEDESVLDKMLDQATDFEERKLIRTALRELRQRKRDQRDKERERRLQEARARAGESRGNTTTETTTRHSQRASDGSSVSTVTKTERLVQSSDGTRTARTTTVESSFVRRSENGGGSTTVQTKTFSSSSSSSSKKMGSIFDREDEASPRPGSLAALEKRQAEKKKELMKAQSLPKTSASQARKAMIEKLEKEGAAGSPGGPRTAVQRSTSFGVPNANSIKQMLLDWCRAKTRGYEHVDIQNFSSSWSDGMAFCALVHNFFPEAFDYGQLNPQNRRQNFEVAFSSAETHADCPQLLDTEDMVRLREPDWKCVYTYIQEFYRCLVQKGLVKTKKS